LVQKTGLSSVLGECAVYCMAVTKRKSTATPVGERRALGEFEDLSPALANTCFAVNAVHGSSLADARLGIVLIRQSRPLRSCCRMSAHGGPVA
jgi:hypothetical protein